MKPTMMVSMVVGFLELLAEAHIKRADDEEGGGDADVDEVVHSVRMVLHPQDAYSSDFAQLRAGPVALKKR